MITKPEKLLNCNSEQLSREIEHIFNSQKTNKQRIGNQLAQIRIEKLKRLVQLLQQVLHYC